MTEDRTCGKIRFMKKQYDDGNLFSGLFKYKYGMSSEQQLDYCLLRLPPTSRASLSATHSARWLSYQIDHLRRTIASGRGTGSFADNIYNSEDPFLSIKPSSSFIGAQILFPITYK